MSSIRLLAKNTIFNMSAYAVTALVSLLTLPYLLHGFGNSAYGVFMIASAIVGTVALFDFGITSVLIKEIAQLSDNDFSEQSKRLVTVGLFWLSLIGIASASVIAGLTFLPSIFSSLSRVEFQLLRSILYIHAVVQLIIWPAKIGQVILAGKQRYDAISFCNIASVIGTAIITVAVILMGRGPLVMVAITTSYAAILSTSLAIYALVNQNKLQADNTQEVVSQQPYSTISKTLLKVSFPLFIAQIAGFIMQQQTDRLVLGIVLGATAVAMYEVAAKLATLMMQLISLTVSAFPPFVARLEQYTSPSEMAHFFLKSSRYLSLILLPIHAVLIAAAPSIVKIWVGEGYQDAILSAQLLLAASMILPLIFTASPILTARDKNNKWAPFAIGTAVINIVLSVLFVKSFGITGVAIATLISYLIDGVLFVAVTSKEIQYSVKKWLQKVVLPALFAATGSYLATMTLNTVFAPGSIPSLLLLLASGVCVGVFTAVLLLTGEERHRNWTRMRRVFGV